MQQVLHGHLYSSTLTVHACIHLFHRDARRAASRDCTRSFWRIPESARHLTEHVVVHSSRGHSPQPWIRCLLPC